MTRSRLLWPAAMAIVTVLVTAACDDDSPSESAPEDSQSAPRLLVLPEGQENDMLAGVSGFLAVNDQGCISIDDRPVVVEDGATVEDRDGYGILFPNGEYHAIGSSVSGGGGAVTADRVDIPDVAGCVDPQDDRPEVLVFSPDDGD